MMTDTATKSEVSPAQLLLEIYLERRLKNAAYSASAFARDAGVSQSFVSLLFAGKKRLSIRRALDICLNLGLDAAETQTFLRSVEPILPVGGSPASPASVVQDRRHFESYELDRFKIISQWYHVAILDMVSLKHFKEDAHWIGKKLDVAPSTVQEAIDRLLRLGLLERVDGRLKKTKAMLYVPTSSSKKAVRSFHSQMIAKAQEELRRGDEASFKAREISGMTMAINTARLTEAKERIQKFQKELTLFLTEGPADGLYQLNTQLFPLIENETTEDHK